MGLPSGQGAVSPHLQHQSTVAWCFVSPKGSKEAHRTSGPSLQPSQGCTISPAAACRAGAQRLVQGHLEVSTRTQGCWYWSRALLTSLAPKSPKPGAPGDFPLSS